MFVFSDELKGHAGSPPEDPERIWEIWDFFLQKYGSNMGGFRIFPDFSSKNMGNM